MECRKGPRAQGESEDSPSFCGWRWLEPGGVLGGGSVFPLQRQKRSKLGGTSVLGCSSLNQEWAGKREPSDRGSGAGDARAFLSPHVRGSPDLCSPHPKTFQRRMETLNLRWEELGIKETQLKAHIQKFEQFIQV